MDNHVRSHTMELITMNTLTAKTKFQGLRGL
ncbi:hypothetical protein APX70_07529, partial [Pseudomonas syringae pv. maculicola]